MPLLWSYVYLHGGAKGTPFKIPRQGGCRKTGSDVSVFSLALNTHQSVRNRSIFGNRTLMKCQICKFAVTGDHDMRFHIRDTHGKFYYPCREIHSSGTHCLKTYTNKKALNEHIIWEHRTEKRLLKEK